MPSSILTDRRVKEKVKEIAIKENKKLKKKLHVLRKKLGHARRKFNKCRLRQEIGKFEPEKKIEP